MMSKQEHSHELETLNVARRWFPKRDGRHPSLKTLYRWTTRGVRGCRLRSVQVGGVRMTQRSWVEDFIHELTARSISGGADTTPSVAQRSRSRRIAARVLDAAGV